MTLGNSINEKIINELKTEGINPPNSVLLKESIISKKHVNKYLYNILLENRHRPTSESKWKQCLPELNNINWNEIYNTSFKTTLDTTLRSFQYKMLMRIIPTNKMLYKFKYVSSSLCDFCSAAIESIEHLFWECSYIQPLWNELNKFIASKSINIVINKKDALLGITSINLHADICNSLIIIMKFYIFNMKTVQHIPTFNAYSTYLKHKIEIEERIALSNDKYEINCKKWKKLSIS